MTPLAGAEAFLHREWRDLRNDAGPMATARVVGALDVLIAARLLTRRDHELWMLRIQTCPGHDDEGGRAWCAYCGDL